MNIPIFMPFGLKFIYPIFRNKEFRLLDVGCGNHSPSVTKKWFSKVKYFGLDKEAYNIDKKDLALMDKFFNIDLLDLSLLDKVPDDFFDVIVISHVIEHIHNGLNVIEAMTQKLKANGYILNILAYEA